MLDIAKTLDRNGLDFQQRMKATGFDPSAFAKNVDDAFERDEIIRDLCQVFLVKKKHLEELGLTGDYPALEKFFQIPSGWLTDPAKFPDARQAIANHREWLKGVGRKMAENG